MQAFLAADVVPQEDQEEDWDEYRYALASEQNSLPENHQCIRILSEFVDSLYEAAMNGRGPLRLDKLLDIQKSVEEELWEEMTDERLNCYHQEPIIRHVHGLRGRLLLCKNMIPRNRDLENVAGVQTTIPDLAKILKVTESVHDILQSPPPNPQTHGHGNNRNHPQTHHQPLLILPQTPILFRHPLRLSPGQFHILRPRNHPPIVIPPILVFTKTHETVDALEMKVPGTDS
ncbi:MAG: hypothetical protein Q9215_000207 [Flavoplaca cf. flavocitrina]